MNMSRECIICDKSLDDGTQTSIVKEKGLEGFIEASKGREDVERPAPILQELEQSTDQKGLKRKHYVAPEIQPGPSKRIICERNAELYAGDNSADEDADDE
ncbi:hypothetical protein PPYR_07331 [Photinus pyralis]|uniref:Uncharacterized protein n=1 Tax=Photinus pyralis TaxID=7054 RepID=A0A5N4AQ66_PHOPY|nr:hypothetical protein PPYR_07331 [Photinus pyralis]